MKRELKELCGLAPAANGKEQKEQGAGPSPGAEAGLEAGGDELPLCWEGPRASSVSPQVIPLHLC